MNAVTVLQIMRAYFADQQPAPDLTRFADLSPQDLLKESMDYVSFVVYLEEELGCDFPLQQLGEATLNQTFAGLAEEVARITPQA